jgi:hypothetical protein
VQAAVIILATLFSLGMLPTRDGAAVDPDLLAAAVRLLTTGMTPVASSLGASIGQHAP